MDGLIFFIEFKIKRECRIEPADFHLLDRSANPTVFTLWLRKKLTTLYIITKKYISNFDYS